MKLGLVTGYNGRLNPKDDITRAESIVIIEIFESVLNLNVLKYACEEW